MANEGNGSGAGGDRRNLVAQLAMPVVVHMEGRIVFATTATADLVGVGVDELHGRSIVEFIHPDDRAFASEEMARVLEGEPSTRRRYRLVRADGVAVWVEAAATPYRFDDEPATLIIIEDVTARLAAEEELRRSELRHRTLVQNSADIVAIIRADGVIAYVSPASEAVLGRHPSDVAGTPVAELVHPDDRMLLASRLALLNRVADGHDVTATIRVQHRDGSWRHLEAVGTAQLGNPAVQGVVINARDVTDRIAAAANLRQLALHDPLTGLANRTLVQDRLRGAAQGSAAVVILDLDRFKDINDSLGHAIGDVVLVEVSERLRRTVRSGDTVGRLGGDEFVVVLPDVRHRDEVLTTVRRILEAIERPVVHDDRRFRLSASAGVAFSPEHAASADGLLRAADAAMYRAKRERSGPAVYDEHDRARSAERLSLTTELADALEDDQFELHYQPEFDLAEGGVAGVEALLRWNHPRRGLVTPDAFLGLAEDVGLIHGLTRWVVDHAVAQAARWRSEGHELPVAVNLSPACLTDAGFVDDVRAALDRHGVPANLLRLEVTERTVMGDPETALAVMRQLTAAGVTFSLDDFGTGYSSLTYLRMLPVAELKIDRSFIGTFERDVDRDIVDTIVTLSRRLRLRVVAEGIESAQAAARLRQLGCHVGQGYHLGRPVPAGELDPEQRIDIDRLEAIELAS